MVPRVAAQVPQVPQAPQASAELPEPVVPQGPLDSPELQAPWVPQDQREQLDSLVVVPRVVLLESAAQPVQPVQPVQPAPVGSAMSVAMPAL